MVFSYVIATGHDEQWLEHRPRMRQTVRISGDGFSSTANICDTLVNDLTASLSFLYVHPLVPSFSLYFPLLFSSCLHFEFPLYSLFFRCSPVFFPFPSEISLRSQTDSNPEKSVDLQVLLQWKDDMKEYLLCSFSFLLISK